MMSLKEALGLFIDEAFLFSECSPFSLSATERGDGREERRHLDSAIGSAEISSRSTLVSKLFSVVGGLQEGI